jgi:hypothetical protein
MNPTKARSFFMNDQYLQLLPVTADELTEGTPNPQFIIELNKRLNAQSERIKTMMTTVGTIDQAIPFTDIMHWRERARYLRSVGQAKRAAALEKAEALKEAKAADNDEEFMEGYKTFLATEFDTQA